MKKFKLFTTIASLCLAVALMAFGVYAAITVNVGVSGYVGIQVDANVKAKVVLTDIVTNADTDSITTLASTVGVVLFESAENAAAAPTTAEKTHNYGNIELKAKDTTKNVVFKYTITITNKATATDTYKYVKVEVTNNPNAEDKSVTLDGYSITGVNNKEYIGVNEEGTFVVTVTLDANRTQTTFSIASALKLTMVENNA